MLSNKNHEKDKEITFQGKPYTQKGKQQEQKPQPQKQQHWLRKNGKNAKFLLKKSWDFSSTDPIIQQFLTLFI